MSSIRLFILDTFARHGEMHGHQLRAQAEAEHVHLWTDISVGSLYQAIKRLAAEGLLTEVRVEREGRFPERQVLAITEDGLAALKDLRRAGLRDIWLKPDPFDLAIARLDPDELDALPAILTARVDRLRAMLGDKLSLNARAAPFLTVAETHALDHTVRRMRSEIDWLDGVIAALPEIIADERTRRPSVGRAGTISPE